MDHPQIWAEIDLGAIAHNVRALCGALQPPTRLMAVVKADGYGHGAVEVARCALKNGASWLGVARLEEALRLRAAGIKAPVLIFGRTSPGEAAVLASHDLAQTVYSLADARALAQRAAALKKTVRVHIKIDTGMGRLGLLPEALQHRPATVDSRAEIAAIFRLSGLRPEGIFTHFAAADRADKTHARRQLKIFTELVQRLRSDGMRFDLVHAANSAALLELPESHLDLVRPGIALYGLNPSDEVPAGRLGLKAAMALKTRVIHLKHVPAGFKVSYGATYETAGPTTIATVAAGYADGLRRGLSSRGRMLVRGVHAPIVGRICMDLTMLDVGHVPGASPGDEVVIFGRQQNAVLPVDELAAALDTINYEIVSGIAARVPRVFLE